VQRGGRILILSVATGKVVRDLAKGTDPSWDPKGTSIAYVTAEGIRLQAPSSTTSRLWKKGALKAPDWSPDGSKIGYVEGGKIKYATSGNGSSVVTTPITALDFSWSPDGKQVLFTRPDHMYVVMADLNGYIRERWGSGGWAGYAAWQPV